MRQTWVFRLWVSDNTGKHKYVGPFLTLRECKEMAEIFSFPYIYAVQSNTGYVTILKNKKKGE